MIVYSLEDTSSVVSLYELDLTTFGGPMLRFCNETNILLANITWKGIVYESIPIEVKGFEITGHNTFPRPIIKISNYTGVLSGLSKQYNDLVGIKFIRRRTRLKYLDAVNFIGGVNPTADPNAFYPDDVFYVNRKISENRLYIEWELTSALDISGIKLPRRQIIQNMCTWKYKSPECSYTGGPVADTNDNATIDPLLDKCGKRVESCKLRFAGSILPYGGFPGASIL